MDTNATMPDSERSDALVVGARAYLRDAANPSNSVHTRYAAALSALGCLYHAGIGNVADWRQVTAWEAVRYEPAVAPTAEDIVEVRRRVDVLLAARDVR